MGSSDPSIPHYHHAYNEEQAEKFRRDTAAGHYDLRSSEIWWRDRSQILEDHGYQLRSRLRPGWKPSWDGTDLNPHYCEDSIPSFSKKVVDAVRKRDGKDVAIMNLPRTSRERCILVYVNNAQLATGKDHHIAPILDSFEDEREPELEFFVMPLLRKYYHPPLNAVSEIISLFRQLLEGLLFLHSLGVAHRDCSHGNIMMDAPSIFPNGFHPCRLSKDRSGARSLKIIPRYKAKGPIRYYFIDFDISLRFEAGEQRMYVGDEGADRDIPEMSAIDFYDPIPADVFILGNLLKKYYIMEYSNLAFLAPLADDMTAKDPEQRPTAEEALKRFNAIVSSQSFFSLRQTLLAKDATRDFRSSIYENFGILVSAALLPVRFAVGLPSRTFGAMRGSVVAKTSKSKVT